MKLPISAIILTYNEEKNIQVCLDSVKDFVQDIFIVDSFSTDQTLSIGKQYTDKIFQHEFENYGRQRNWALDNLPIKTEWILNLDADHRVSKNLKNELIELFSNQVDDEINGFLTSRKTFFLGSWIRHGGHYPVYHAVLFKRDKGRCEELLYDQHFVVNGKLKTINGDIEDIVTDSLSNFILKHNRWASLEAAESLLSKDENDQINQNYFGNPIEKRRFLKKSIYMKLPIFVRPFMYFFYRYFVRLGFLDGKEGLVFHFLQGLWFRFLVDAKIYEMKKRAK